MRSPGANLRAVVNSSFATENEAMGQLGRIVTGVGGVAVGVLGYRMLGFNFLIPLLSLLACWFLFRRAATPRHLLLPLTFSAGHGVWFAVALAMAYAAGNFEQYLLDIGPEILIIAILVAWIYLRRSKASLYALIVYEVISVGLSGYSMTIQTSLEMQSVLAIHIIIRCAAIITAAMAIRSTAEVAKAA
jgi:hypothetical protein